MWFISRGGQSLGPIDDSALRQMIAAGHVSPDDFLWREGWPEWQAARQVLGIGAPARPPAQPAARAPRAEPGRAGPAPTKGWIDAKAHAADQGLTSFLTTYAPLAGGLSVVADLAQPVLEMTRPIAIVSPILAALLWSLARIAPTNRVRLETASRFCLLLFACSAVWWGLQLAFPESRSKGVLVELVPGVEALQDAVVNSMSRVEQQTKRVGDILEEQARKEDEQERAARDEMEAFEKQQIDQAKADLAEAGYAADANGYVAALKQDYANLSSFETLGVKLTAEATIEGLRTAVDESEIDKLTYYVQIQKDQVAFLRAIEQALYEDGARLHKLFQGSGAHGKVCDSAAIKHPIAVVKLEEICRTDGLPFAVKYSDYFTRAYSRLGQARAGDKSYFGLTPSQYAIKAVSALPVVKSPGPLSLRTLKDCTYYEGAYSFFIYGGLNPYGAFEKAGSADITFFDVADPDFGQHQFDSNCPYADVVTRIRPQCRARVVVASKCESLMQPTIIKVLQVLN